MESWGRRKAGKFFVAKHLKKYSILIGEGEAVYGVLGLASTLTEVVPFTPCYAEAVLLPFDGRIIYDSLLAPYNVLLGSGYRRDLERTYKDAKERGAIITSLSPAGPADPEEEREAARSTETKVLDAFRKHLCSPSLESRRWRSRTRPAWPPSPRSTCSNEPTPARSGISGRTTCAASSRTSRQRANDPRKRCSG